MSIDTNNSAETALTESDWKHNEGRRAGWEEAIRLLEESARESREGSVWHGGPLDGASKYNVHIYAARYLRQAMPAVALWQTPGLSRRAQNILHSLMITHNVVTVKDLASLDGSVLKNARNVGRKTRKELHTLVTSSGATPSWSYSP